jgi:methanogenic corrinoid protein MtbC1
LTNIVQFELKMAELEEIPLYRLGFVACKVGLTPDTIRAWERRYGLPQPRRTGGGHRLYSGRDVATLQWLKARMNEGMSIRQAVGLWRQLVVQGVDPLREPGPFRPEHPDLLRTAWVQACLAYDEEGADAVISRALALYDIETVLEQVLRPGLRQVGDLWYRNEATVEQEHFASQVASRRLYALLSQQPPGIRRQVVLLGTPEGELHDLPVLFLAVFLRRRGYRTLLLGAQLPGQPPGHLQPAVAVLSCQWLGPVPALQRLAARLLEAGIRVAFLGRVFRIHPRLAEQVPGFLLPDDLARAVSGVDALLEAAPPEPELPRTAPWVCRAAGALEAVAPRLNSYLTERLGAAGAEAVQVVAVAAQALSIIRAAVLLGDLDLLDPELEWVGGMLVARGLDPGLVGSFCLVLSEGLARLAPDDAKPLATWLAQRAEVWAGGAGR